MPGTTCRCRSDASTSSLVATHLATEALARRRCGTRVVAGVNVLLGAGAFVMFCQTSMLVPDSRCKTFDGAADGYARGEGCGIMVMVPDSNTPAHGLVRGTFVN